MPIERRLVLSSLLLLGAVGASAPAFSKTTVGSGTAATESRTPGAFSAVVGSGAVDLVVRQGSRDAVELTADDNLLPLLETVIEDRRGAPTLVVRWKRGESVRSGSKMRVVVTALRLTSIATEGAGDITVEKMESPTLVLATAGAGNIKASQLKCDELSMRTAGAGDLQASGSTGKLVISIAGAGDVNTPDLAAEDVKVSIAGAGDAVVQASKRLQVSIAGSGDVRYVGQPTITKSVVGSGSVRPR